MQVILKEDVKNLGKSGDLVKVKDGYGRNFLLPQGLALPATRGNVAQLNHHKRVITAQNLRLARDAQAIADRLTTIEVVIARQAGEGDKLFGSVVSRDVVEALASHQLPLDKKLIHLEEPIKSLGDHQVEVKLGQGVVGIIKVKVVRSE